MSSPQQSKNFSRVGGEKKMSLVIYTWDKWRPNIITELCLHLEDSWELSLRLRVSASAQNVALSAAVTDALWILRHRKIGWAREQDRGHACDRIPLFDGTRRSTFSVSCLCVAAPPFHSNFTVLLATLPGWDGRGRNWISQTFADKMVDLNVN